MRWGGEVRDAQKATSICFAWFVGVAIRGRDAEYAAYPCRFVAAALFIAQM